MIRNVSLWHFTSFAATHHFWSLLESQLNRSTQHLRNEKIGLVIGYRKMMPALNET